MFQCIITLALLVIEDVYSLINYVSFVEALFISISVLGLLWLRYKRPHINRPIKVKSRTELLMIVRYNLYELNNQFILSSPFENYTGQTLTFID